MPPTIRNGSGAFFVGGPRIDASIDLLPPARVDRPAPLRYPAGITSDPDMHTLARDVAVMEERMNVLQANLTATLEGFRTDQAKLREDMALHREDAAKRDVEAVKRDKDNQRWVVGFGLAQMVLTVAVLAAGFAFLGILIGLPS